MEEGIETTEKEADRQREGSTTPQPRSEIAPAPEFVKIEKNLASLGFFTPSSKRLRNAQEKSFTITTVADGQRLELKGTIIPSAKYGLPITADQDKWIALCKILTDILQREGRVSNPISFTSAEILRLLHKHRHSGKNYREIEEWLDVLFSTTIFSEGVVYLASEKRRVKDRFRVFERAVSFGKELPDGRRADKNYVWFSEWQLQNINSNHLLPIDIEAYRELKNHISKALVPLLQVWLYATRDEGVYEKRYSELCQILNIQQYRYFSLIQRTLAPSLDELKQFGYLADWQIEKTSDGQNYKIVFHHGEKFHRDRRARLNRKRTTNQPEARPAGADQSDGATPRRESTHFAAPQQSPHAVLPQPMFAPELVAEFTRRGIGENKAIQLLTNLKPGQDVVAQLELGEQIVRQSRVPIQNPPGFMIRLIESNTSVPESFETSTKRKVREEREREERNRREEEEARQLLEWEYEDYCQRETAQYIEGHPDILEGVRNATWNELRDRYQSFSPEMITTMAMGDAKREIRKLLLLPTFQEFLDQKKQGTDFSMKPVAPIQSVEAEPASPVLENLAPDERAGDSPTAAPAMAAAPEPAIEPAPNPAMEVTEPKPLLILIEVLEPPQQGFEACPGSQLA